MQAVILAGGLGTRLRSIVNDKPKPMAEIAGKPFLEYQIEFLKRHQISELVFCVGYLHHLIQDYFGDGARWGVKINYAVEEELLGTAGALKNAERYLQESFVVLNGDSFFDFDLTAFHEFHKNWKSEQRSYLGSIALTEVNDTRDYGAITTDAGGRILAFDEKTTTSTPEKQINAGAYILQREVMNTIPRHVRVSLERETFPALLQQGRILGGYRACGFFVDIGTPSGFQKFQKHLMEAQAA